MATRNSARQPSRLRRTLLIIAAITLGLFGVAAGYTLLFSMGKARPVDIAGAAGGPNVLVATQDSKFKDAVVDRLLDHLRRRSAHVRVIDISALPGINEADWDALVLIHTWQAGKPPTVVKTFVNGTRQRNKLVVLTTSGSGESRLEGVDAISAASKMTDVPAQTSEMIERLDAVLATANKPDTQ